MALCNKPTRHVVCACTLDRVNRSLELCHYKNSKHATRYCRLMKFINRHAPLLQLTTAQRAGIIKKLSDLFIGFVFTDKLHKPTISSDPNHCACAQDMSIQPI